jgi:hypothetical protein
MTKKHDVNVIFIAADYTVRCLLMLVFYSKYKILKISPKSTILPLIKLL